MDTFALYYFSATGNSFVVASSLAQRLGSAEPISIPGSLVLADPYEAMRTATKIGFIFPVHRATMPEMVRGFIEQMPIDEDCYYFAISTYTLFGCNEFWDIDELLGQKNGALNFARRVRMMGNVGLAPPSKAAISRRNAQMQIQLDEIADEVLNGQERYFNPSIKPLKAAVRRYNSMRRKHITFRINEQCTLCGTCVQVCPAQNINLSSIKAGKTQQDAAPLRSDKCEACYACLHWCPAGAISTSHRLHNHYHNPQVSPDQLNQIPSRLKLHTTERSKRNVS